MIYVLRFIITTMDPEVSDVSPDLTFWLQTHFQNGI